MQQGPSGHKAKNIYCLVLYRKGLPTPDLDDCGICLKKKKKKEKKENKDYWELSLSRQRETELKFHAPFQTVPWSQWHAICHGTIMTIIAKDTYLA